MVEENWLKVAVKAMSLGIGLYIIPLVMIASPELIALKQTPLLALMAFAKTAIALIAISYGLINRSLQWRRLPLLLMGLALLFGV
jgi:TRAP-type uncharacterized transport system fused permease subunit